jgi:putative aldouronate transport system permease protein
MAVERRGILNYRLWIYLVFILVALSFIVPFVYVLTASVTTEEYIQHHGYKMLPRELSFAAFDLVFRNPAKIRNAYLVTAFQAAIGTLAGIVIMSLCAYTLSVPDFRLKRSITFYIFFTMLFSGGLIPAYILNTQYLRIGNTIWIYIIPSLASAFYIIIFRTFFQSLPSSLRESAKIDGAGEWVVYLRIIMPLSKPVLATIALFVVLDRWNDWYTSLIYVRKPELYTLQFLLQQILMQAQLVRDMAKEFPQYFKASDMKLPVEGIRFAMVVVAAGPMLVIFPFFQKYFVRGLTIGAIKG